MSEAIGVLYTFTTYGTHLAGSASGSVSKDNRNWGAPRTLPNFAWQDQSRKLMPESAFILGPKERDVVLDAIRNACTFRRWHLFAAHVRTNHVHAIIQSNVPADRTLSYLKARSTFELRQVHPSRQHFWTKHGSTQYLWHRKSLDAAIDYVLNQQGDRMACWSDA